MMNPAARYCFIATALCSSMTYGQTMNDLGMMGGSGIAFTPTLAVTPESHIRVNTMRMVLLKSGTATLNSFGMTTGLSSNMEFTTKFQSARAGNSYALSFVGFAGKFVLPFNLPFESHAAIWTEFVTNTNENTSLFFPSGITRTAFIVQPEILLGVNGNIMLGLSDVDHTRRVIAGCNASRIAGEWVKVGGELVYNYYGENDLQESLVILFRAHPNMCFQLSPGYLHTPEASSWMISFGASFSSTGIDFVRSEKSKEKKNEIPTIDELEKQIRDEQKKDKEN